LDKTKVITFSVILLITGFLITKGYKSAVVKTDNVPLTYRGTFDIERFIQSELDVAGQDVMAIHQQLTESNDKVALQQVVQIWDTLSPLVAAHFFSKYAAIETNEQNWYILGTKYLNIAAQQHDSSIAMYATAQAKTAFEKALKLNPNSLAAKTGFATTIIELDGNVMEAVTMLREVVDADSNFVQAIYTLGVLSMRSQQYDKAIARFIRLTQIQPFNAENYFYLAEAYANFGDTRSAINSYEKCKTLLSDSEAQTEIEKIIKQLKNI
jgi:tetratricopeptide (TPR) repeat protein